MDFYVFIREKSWIYRVNRVVMDLGSVDFDFANSLPAQFCSGRWEFGIIGWTAGKDDGTLKSKSTQPRSTTTRFTLYKTGFPFELTIKFTTKRFGCLRARLGPRLSGREEELGRGEAAARGDNPHPRLRPQRHQPREAGGRCEETAVEPELNLVCIICFYSSYFLLRDRAAEIPTHGPFISPFLPTGGARDLEVSRRFFT